MSEDDVAGVGNYEGAAAGWGALKAVADAVRGHPEANVLVALDHYDARSGTPSYKSPPVLLRASPNHEVLRRLVETADVDEVYAM